MNVVTREEKKFLINIDEFRSKSHYLDSLMIQDEHNGTDGYIIRSLYFDTVYDDAFYEYNKDNKNPLYILHGVSWL